MRTHRMVTALWLTVLLLLCWSLRIPMASAEPIQLAIDVVWTNGIDANRNPLNSYEDKASGKPLCLWMKISGQEDVMELLRAQDKLPIRHKWYRVIGGKAYHDINKSLEQWLNIDDIELAVGHPTKNKALEQELTNRGFFDWRTWSCKKNITPGRWRVRIVLKNGELACDHCQVDIRY